MSTGSKRLKWNAVIGLLVVAMLPVVAPPTPVNAASIVVTTSLDVVADDGNCSLREAITAANTDAFVIGCGAGSGADTITFWADTTIALGSRLPLITSNVTIDGTGQSVSIDGQNSRAIARVQSSGNLTLNGLNVIRGIQQGCDGGDTCGTVLNYGNLQVNDSEFSGNQGGGFTNGIAITNRGGGTLAVNSSTFTNNQGAVTGAVWNASDGSNTLTVASITNSTFSGNTAGGAADIYNTFNASLTVTNSTFSDGQGDSSIKNAGGADTVIRNSIISPRAGTPACVAPNGTFDVNATNFATGATCGTANVVVAADLDLQPLALNGGPTRTIALGEFSEVKDAGDATICAAPPVNNLDQRGETRPQGFGCDPGAFELEFVAPQPTFFTEDFDSNTLGSNLEARQGSPNPSGGTVMMPSAEGNIVATLDAIYEQADFCAQVTVVSQIGATDNRAYLGFGRGNTAAGDNSSPAAADAVVLQNIGNSGTNDLTIVAADEFGGSQFISAGVGPGTAPYTLSLEVSGTSAIGLFVNGLRKGTVDASSYSFFNGARVFFAGENVTFDNFSVESGACAQTFTFINTAPGADWSVGANWSGGFVPGPGTSALIPAGVEMTVAAGPGQEIGDLTVDTGALVTIDDAGSLAVSGTLTVDGDVVIDEGGRLTFDGPAAQDVFGTGTVSNAGTIEIDTENAVSLDATLTLTSAPTSSIDSRTAGGSFIVQSDYAELGAINVGPGASVEFVAGLFTADPSALIDVEISATLAGRLNFRESVLPIFNGAALTTTLVGGYIPAGADSYDIAICTDGAGAIGGDCGFDFTLNVSDAAVAILPDRVTISATAPDPIAHWTFDEASSGTGTGTVVDEAGGPDGPISGNAEYIPGIIGAGALSFDGTDDFIDFGLRPDLDLTSAVPGGPPPGIGDEYTIAFWIQSPDPVGTGTIERVITMDDAANTSGGYSIIAGPGDSCCRITHNTGAPNDSGATYLTSEGGDWRHVAATFRDDQITFYYDGVAQTPIFNTDGTLRTDGDDPLIIGSVFNNGSYIQYLDGALDDVRLYDAVLTAAQVQALAVIPDPPPTPPTATNFTFDVVDDSGTPGETQVGVGAVPILDIPIESIVGANGATYESAPLGSIPLGSIPLGSIDLEASPLGSIPLGSIPLGSIDLEASPLGSIPLGSIPLGSIGGWGEVLVGTALEGKPLQTVTLEDVLALDPLPSGVMGISLADVALEDSPLGSISLPAISLGDQDLLAIDPTLCANISFDCSDPATDTLIELQIASAPLGSIPLGSIPLGSIPLGSIPLGSIPLGSIPLGSIPLGSIPLGSIPLGSINLEGAPLGSIPLGSIPLGSIDLSGTPLGSIPLGSIGGCVAADGSSTCDTLDDSSTLDEFLAALGVQTLEEFISSLPSGSTIGDTPLGSIPLGSIPLGSIPLGSIDLLGAPLGSIPLGSIPLGSIPLGSIDVNSAPLGSIPLGSIPLDSIPLGSIPLGSIGDLGGCAALAGSTVDCTTLGLTDDDSAADFVAALPDGMTISSFIEALPTGTTISDTPLGSIPLGSIPLGSIPLGSIPLGSIPLGSIGLDAAALARTPLGSIPLGSIPLGSIGVDDTCAAIAGSALDCDALGLTDLSTLLDYVTELPDGTTIADSPLGSIPLGSIPLGSIPLGSIDLETVEINGAPLGSIPLGSIGLNGTGLAGTPLGSIPLGSIDLTATPLGSIPLGSIPLGSIDSVVNCSLVDCEAASLAAATSAGALEPGATLGQLGEYGETSLGDLSVYGTGIYGDLTLGELDNLLTLELLYGDSTLGQAGNDYGDMTFGQILVSTMLQSDFPWETLPLADLGLQEIAPTGTVSYTAAFDLTGDGFALPSEIRASIPDDFFVVPGSTNLVTDGVPAPTADATIASPVPGEQELTFDLALDAGYSYQITFDAVPGFETGTVTTDAQLTVGAPIVGPGTDSTTIAVTEYFTGNNDFGDATDVPSDTLVFSHTSTPRTSDYFQFEPGPTGTRHVVFVSQFDVDTDIVLYKPATEQVSEVAPRSIPLGSTPIGDDGVDYGGDDTQEPALQGDFDIQSAPIGSVSINRGTTAETVESTISSAPISAADPYVIQVSGYQGNASQSPYVVRVKKEQLVTAPTCPATGFTHGPASGVNISELPLGLNTVFLFNEERTAQQYGETEATAIRASLDALVANGANGVVGAVIPVESDPEVQAAYTAWDESPCDTDKANDVVGGITDLLAQIRTEHPTLGYITIVGNDDMVPFARLDDLTSIANEGTFTEQFTDGALLGALATRHYLSDDPYGDIDPVQWLDRQLHMPELALGRLVENPSEIIGALDNFVEFDGRLDPQTAAVAGYDFLADGTTVILDRLTNIYGEAFVEGLIDASGTEAASTWTLADLLAFLDLSDPTPGSDTADIITVNAHSDQYRQLPSFGDASKDESDLFSVDDLGPLPLDGLLGNIVFTMGCHAGLSVSDIGVSAANSADWAQAYSERGALYVANSGFGYGDTVSVALSERLMAEFAENLDGATTVGQAMAFAKQEYFAQLGQYGPYDEKAMQQVIFYGLPMYSVGTTPPPEPPEPLPTALDPSLGLQAASIGITPVYDSTTTDGIGTYLSIDGQTQNTQFRPIQPLQTIDISQDPTELLAHGAIITEATTTDVGGFDPVYFRPNVTGSAQVEPEAPSDEMATEIFDLNIATYNGPGVGPNGEPFVQQQQATLIAGSFRSPADGSQLGVQRTIDDAEVVVVYADPSSTDFEAPYISSVDSVLVSNQVSFTATTDATDIAAAIVLYRQSSASGTSSWASTPLVPDATGRTFSGGGPVDSSAIVGDGVDYKLWLVDTSGNVSSSDSKNVLWQAIAPPPPVVPEALTLTVPTPPAIGWYTGDVVIPFEGVAGVTYTVLDAGGPAQTIVGSGDITVTGDGVHEIIVEGGGLTARLTVLIDTSSPEVDSTSIIADELIEQDSVQTFEYECVDAGAGIAAGGCTAEIGVSPLTPGTGSTIEPGGVIDTSTPGDYDIIITAIDELGNETTSTVTFSIEDAPPADFLPEIVLIDAPTTPQLITDGVFIDVEFDDGNGDGDDYEVTIDWGNVDETEAIDSADTCTATSSTPTTGATSCQVVAEPTGTDAGDGVFTAQFQYPLPGVYPITVTITDSAGNVDTATTDEFVVVYDPEAGRVSGAGIYWSGPEAYEDGPSWGSPAFFGYNARYKGTNPEPRGKTKVRLFGEFFFKSTGYDYLIINDTLAVAEGVGKLDGQSGYRFKVQGVDNGWADFFQIEIWDDTTGEKVYDNGILYDSSTDVLLGGIRVKSR